MDWYYPTRLFVAIFVPTTGRTARILQNGIIIKTARPCVFDHVYGTGNNQSNTHGLILYIIVIFYFQSLANFDFRLLTLLISKVLALVRWSNSDSSSLKDKF